MTEGPPSDRPPPGRLAPDRLSPARLTAIDAAVERALADGRTPGLALSVVDRDGLVVERTSGYADRAARAPVTRAHLFEIGSIGKTFTAIALLTLVEEGRLDLRAPVARYLPWFDVPRVGDAGPIEVHHLLSHTAGIVAGPDATPEAVVQVMALRDLVPGSAPGERFHYSNVGYKALGLLLARLEGRPYREVIRRRVLEPLGMTSTEPAIGNAIRARLAVGHENREDDRIGHAGRALAPATWLETDTGDGSIASTAAEMGAFARMLLREGEGPAGRLLSESSFAALRGPYSVPEEGFGYGYGLSTRTIEGRTFIGHGGGMVGYRAALQVEPASGIGAVVLQNGPGANPMGLAREVIGLAAGWGEEGPADPGGALGAGAQALVGRWWAAGGIARVLDVRAPAGRLVARVDERDIELLPWGERAWLLPDPAVDDSLLRLLPQTDGAIEVWHADQRFVRDGDEVPPPAPVPADLLRHPGRYRSHDPWCPVLRVLLRGDRLWLTFPAPPDGFDDEQPLVPLADGWFRVGDDPGGPERMRFDITHEGRSLRAWLSGWPYYRVD